MRLRIDWGGYVSARVSVAGKFLCVELLAESAMSLAVSGLKPVPESSCSDERNPSVRALHNEAASGK